MEKVQDPKEQARLHRIAAEAHKDAQTTWNCVQQGLWPMADYAACAAQAWEKTYAVLPKLVPELQLHGHGPAALYHQEQAQALDRIPPQLFRKFSERFGLIADGERPNRHSDGEWDV